MIEERNKKFWQIIKKENISPVAFLVINPKNIFYLTSFKGEGILLLTPEQNYLITDGRYTEQAEQEARHCKIMVQSLKESDAQTISLTALLAELKIDELGFESEFLKVNKFLKYQQMLPQTKLLPFPDIIENIRMIKDQSEISLIQQAAQIADQAFRETLGNLTTGVSEFTLANELNCCMRKNGATKEAFDIIVTSGERGTLIHGEPSDKKITNDELIIIDFGAVFGGYHSDCTRTVMLSKGKANNQQEKLFNLVKEVQLETLEQIKAGVLCDELDKYARDKFSEKGYGDYFQHSLGHGVGLDIHELPRLSSYSNTILEPNMVVTIEPGLYVPGIGGARLEDTVVVTESGCDILTTLPKELMLSF